MIPFDFEYYRPDSFQEAVGMYRKLQADGKKPLYFCGGTEIITMARLNQLYTQAVIDIKKIPECGVFEADSDRLVIGSSITLARLEEERAFPLLSRVCNRIADHTSRCKITLGGNLCGKIMYRETVLPLLLADSEIVIAGESGLRKASIHECFEKQMNLGSGEFIVQIMTLKRYTELPYVTEKKTKIDRIDYPLVTTAALKDGSSLRIAFSGICEFPFRSPAIEKTLNDRNMDAPNKVASAISLLPDRVVDDIYGSSEYRKFVFANLLNDVMETFEGEIG